tara:strand:+ start:294 stop:518 length:225 start_codon:yes stop_codon:yes gene_type:complete
MKIEEIKTAIDNGKRVHWHHSGYEVIGSRKDGYLIKCHMNNHCVGLHGMEGTKFENQMNGEEKDFYIRATEEKV